MNRLARNKSTSDYIKREADARLKISDSEKYIPGRKKPYMDDAEIVYRYRNALHPAKQINILAQLNDVAAAKIISVLERNGIEIRKKAK